MLGHAHSLEDITKFSLLDLDPTAIPSNTRGIILRVKTSKSSKINIVPGTEGLRSIEEMRPDTLDQDLSSHIEPDWDNDIQACRIVYRYKGRILRRFIPIQIEQAVLHLTNLKTILPLSRAHESLLQSQACVQGIESLLDNKCPVPRNARSQGASI